MVEEVRVSTIWNDLRKNYICRYRWKGKDVCIYK
jgi:hypothetical protein